MSIQRIGDLEISQDLDFQRRSWKVQRVGWMLMGLFVIATVLGLLGGSGLLSDTTTGSEADGLQIQYHRFLRQGKPTSLNIHAQAKDGQNQVKVQIDQSYLNRFKLDEVVPEPSQTEAQSGQLIFTFDLAQPGEVIDIKFDLRPEHGGPIVGQIGSEGGPVLDVSQFVYP